MDLITRRTGRTLTIELPQKRLLRAPANSFQKVISGITVDHVATIAISASLISSTVYAGMHRDNVVDGTKAGLSLSFAISVVAAAVHYLDDKYTDTALWGIFAASIALSLASIPNQ